MSDFDVWPTKLGKQDLEALTGPHKAAAASKLRELEAQGCAAGGYRLRGLDDVGPICAVHLTGNWRLITAYPEPGEVCVLLVGQHDDQHPDVDVYRTLYDALGLEEYPIGDAKHPHACCEDNGPPVDGAVVDRFLAGAAGLAAARRRELGRTRRHSHRN